MPASARLTNFVGSGNTTVNVANAGRPLSTPASLHDALPTSKNTIVVDDSADSTARTLTLSTFAPNPNDSEGNNDPYGKLGSPSFANINFEYADKIGRAHD